jgi:class 3 adenylate cyclase/tetratricopeptide (TPR) repeat protein
VSETVAATFLFTDLVGSTALSTGLLPEAAETLRQTHFGLLRGAIAEAGGTEVKNLGDGLMVTFPSASRAMAAAVAMQQGIEQHNRRAEHQLAVRIGVSTGEATFDDDDYFGDPVIEAARLCAVADGGQILVTELARLTAGRRVAHECIPLGALELKGLSEPVETVEVCWAPALDVDAAGGIPLPGRLRATVSLFGFAGRAAEIDAVDSARKSAFTDEALRVVLLGGEPGIGKTTIAAEIARSAHHAGATVLLGECEEGSGAPFQPWISALSHLVRFAPADLLAAVRPVDASALRRLLATQAERLPPGEEVATDPDTERFLLMEAIVRFVELATASSPMVIVLDDLHWADAATLSLLRHLVNASASMRALVIATYRPSDLLRTHPLTTLLADFHREPNVSRIELTGISDVEIVELIQTAAGYDIGDEGVTLAHALRRETDGNPFFVTELLRHLGESGDVVQGADGRYELNTELDAVALPASVRDVVGRRVARLGDDAMHILAGAAVIGRDFDIDVLATVAEVSADEVLDALEQADQAALVEELPDDPGRYRFAHALIQHTMYQEMSSARRQRMHRRVAEALETLPAAGGDDAARLAELASHWHAATTPTDSSKAIDYARRAGDAALGALSPVDAANWYTQALDLVNRNTPVDVRLRCELLISLGSAQLPIDIRTGTATLEDAGSDADRLGDVDLLVRWAFTRLHGWTVSEPADNERLRLLYRTLELIGTDDLSLRARLRASITEETDPSEWRRRHELADAALADARAAGDDDAELYVQLSTLFTRGPKEAHDAVSMAERVLQLAEATADQIMISTALQHLMVSSLLVGDDIRAASIFARLEAMNDRLRIPPLRHSIAMLSVGRAMQAGNLKESERYADALLELAATAFPSALATYGGALFEIRWAQGRLDEVAPMFESAIDEMASYAGYRPALVTVYCETGQLEPAREIFKRDADSDFDDFPYDTVWLSCMHLYAEAAVALQERTAAEALYERLLPFGELFAATGPIYYGVTHRPLGRLAHLLGRCDDAERHLRDGLRVHRERQAKYWMTRNALDLAETLRTRPGSEQEARTLIAEATKAASEGGFGAELRRADGF